MKNFREPFGLVAPLIKKSDASMKKFLALTVLAAGLGTANAADLFYVANLTPGQEAFHNDDPQGVPPDRSGTGTANFTLTDTGRFAVSGIE